MRPPANDNERSAPFLLGFSLQFQRLSGPWRNLACILLGVGVTLALPPLYFLPFLLISMPGFAWITQSAPTRRRAFWDGWFFGMGNFASGLYWITNALLVDADKFGWLSPFAVLGLSAGFSIYLGGVGLVLHATRNQAGVRRVLVATLAWLAAEWLRGHMLTGFPWNLIAYSWTFSVTTMQPAAWVGSYGLSLITALLAFSPIVLSSVNASEKQERRARWHMGALWAAFALLLLAAGQRIPMQETGSVPGITLRLVQGNIAQSLKWDPQKRLESIGKYMALSRSAGAGKVTHLIWPESAMPVPFESGDQWAEKLAEIVPEKGLLLTGDVRVEGDREAGTLKVYNSLKLLNHAAQVEMAYDKYKLVPFGEFVPLRNYLPLDKVTPGAIDFSSGPPPAPIAVSSLPPLWPLICYEAAFPELAAGAHPAWLLNITNDAWFGNSTGPYQHFAMSRMRAVEQGVPLVRAANTGISAVVDPYGRVLHSLPLGVGGVIDSALPLGLQEPSLFGRFGGLVLWALIFSLGLWYMVFPEE